VAGQRPLDYTLSPLKTNTLNYALSLSLAAMGALAATLVGAYLA
jgi:hypothetical protein